LVYDFGEGHVFLGVCIDDHRQRLIRLFDNFVGRQHADAVERCVNIDGFGISVVLCSKAGAAACPIVTKNGIMAGNRVREARAYPPDTHVQWPKP
jgi:hypothetical protein